MAFKIVSSGIYLPRNQWSAEQLDDFLGLPPGTACTKYGVQYRHVADPSETAIFMAGQAARQCLEQAKRVIDHVDLLIYASGTHHQSLPYDASALMAELMAPPAIQNFDLNSTCLSFLTALDIAHSLFIAQRHQRILIVTSELATGVTLNQSFAPNIEVATLFADGAAAFLLESDPHCAGLLHRRFETHYQGYDYCQIKGGGSAMNPHQISHEDNLQACQFTMEGKKLYRNTQAALPAFLAAGFAQCPVNKEDIDYVIPHQASFHALKKLPTMIGFPSDKITNRFATLGNQVAASLPINLHFLRTQADTHGHHVLLMGTAAGLTMGMGLLQL